MASASNGSAHEPLVAGGRAMALLNAHLSADKSDTDDSDSDSGAGTDYVAALHEQSQQRGQPTQSRATVAPVRAANYHKHKSTLVINSLARSLSGASIGCRATQWAHGEQARQPGELAAGGDASLAAESVASNPQESRSARTRLSGGHRGGGGPLRQLTKWLELRLNCK